MGTSVASEQTELGDLLREEQMLGIPPKSNARIANLPNTVPNLHRQYSRRY